MGVNKVIIVGNLGKDPEVRYTQSGSAVCNLRLAVTERRKEGDGWKDHTEWVSCVAFGKTAENVGQYLSKGRQVYVEGRMQTRSYKDKDGTEKWSTEVVVNQILFLGDGGGARNESRGGGARGGGGEARGGELGGGDYGRGTVSGPGHGGGGDNGFIDDDLPF